MFRKNHARILPLFVSSFLPIIIVVLLTACGAGGGGNSDSGMTNNGSNSIGSNGGTVTSSDGKAKIVISSGALSQDTGITVTAVSNQPSGNIGTAYEFGPDGTTFNEPVTISITYDEASLPSGVSESDIKLGMVTNNQWQEITNSNVDTVANIVSGTTSHLSTYGIVAINTDSVPRAPTGVVTTAGDGNSNISWNAVSGATLYNIYWSTTSGVSKTSYTGKITGVTSPYPHTGRTNGTTYYYVVTTVNDFGESVESSQVMVMPQAPISLPKTGQTTSYAAGDDGDLLKGVAWPSPRFADNGDGTVTDNLTGLIWTKDGNAPGSAACYTATAKEWQAALDYVACLNTNSYLGYTDWRLPNVNELRSLFNIGQNSDTIAWLSTQGFNNVQSRNYWTSTSFDNFTASALVVNMWNGYVSITNKSSSFSYSYLAVWPVRSGQPGTFGNSVTPLPQTGQTSCYNTFGHMIDCSGTGQDGDIQAGVTWPSPRFTDNGSGILTDKLTNLIWTKDGNAPGPAACYPATAKLWQAALDYVTCLNTNSYLGYTDWRLPNINELRSLKNEGQSDTAIWLNNHGFTNAQSGGYWSSTTYANIPSAAWTVNFVYMVVEEEKSLSYMSAWPVRSGQ